MLKKKEIISVLTVTVQNVQVVPDVCTVGFPVTKQITRCVIKIAQKNVYN